MSNFRTFIRLDSQLLRITAYILRLLLSYPVVRFFIFCMLLLYRQTSRVIGTRFLFNQVCRLSRMDGESKRQCLRIGTHSGSFHCDEALGCFMLKQTDRFKDAQIVRSRNPDVLKELDVVIDVGGVYDADCLRFDHHQKGFDQVFGHGFNTKLSSAGLVFKHFGKEVISNILGLHKNDKNMDAVYLAVYKQFMEAVDAIDNGVNPWDGDEPPKYVNTTTLSSRVSFLNPNWNEPTSPEIEDSRFAQAMELTGKEFKESVEYIGKVWLPAREFVKEAINQRFDVDPSGEVMRLNTFCPWKEHLYELEEELKMDPKLKYCLYEDEREKKWRVQAIGMAPGSFQSRKPLPQAWRGLRNDELDKASGITGTVFVHISGFIGGHDNYDGALEMARQALKLD